MKLPEKERKAYDAYLRHLMSIARRNHSIEIDSKDIIKKAQEDKEIEAVLGLNENDVPVEIIAKSLKISKESVFQIIDKGQ
jgi:hypothetical protein